MANIIREMSECCHVTIKDRQRFPFVCDGCNTPTRMVKEVRCSCGRKHVTSSRGDSECSCGNEFNILGDELVSRDQWEEDYDDY